MKIEDDTTLYSSSIFIRRFFNKVPFTPSVLMS